VAKRTPGGSEGRTRHAPAHSRILGRHRLLLSDPKVKSWWEARSLRSRLSADTYLRQLGFLLERIHLDPDQVVRLARADPDRLRDLLTRDAAALKQQGKLDSYISKFFEGLKSYLKFHRAAFDGFPSLSPIKGESLANERIPSPEELGRVLDRLPLRGRVTALFMAHAGLRPGVLAAYQASNGLILRDLTDLDLEGTPKFANVPFAIRVPAGLSKTRVSYMTFGSSQLASAFLAYLDERRQGGEKLDSDSPVIAANAVRGVALRNRKEARNAGRFLTTTTLVKVIHDALHGSAPRGVRWRPYVLRSYCSTRLLMAEGAGKITRDLREALLGHDGGVAARYNVGKTWGPELLKDARASYARAETYLATSQSKAAEDVVTEMRRTMLQGLGYTEEELKPIDLVEMDLGKFQTLVEKKRLESLQEIRGRKQKLVRDTELGGYLEQGWTVVTTVNGQVVISPPAH
jgi:hypothetical protein